MKHPVDIGAIASYVAGGGLAGIAGLLAVVDPGHSAIYLSSGGVLVAVAGLVRVIANPTPPVGQQAAPTVPVSPTPNSTVPSQSSATFPSQNPPHP